MNSWMSLCEAVITGSVWLGRRDLPTQGRSARIPLWTRNYNLRMITDVPGIRCGHWTDPVALTGCTVVLLPESTVASAEVRGGAPASRELEAVGVGRLVEEAHAVLLTGGSAFGLAAADGVMAWCEEKGIGYDTLFARVPIVPSLGIFDLGVGDSSVRPGPAAGRSACESATDGPIELGQVGAGTGATVGKWKGPDNTRRSGIASLTLRQDELIVSSLVVVNAFGDIEHGGAEVRFDGDHLGETGSTGAATGGTENPPPGSNVAMTNTTIGVVATNARLDKVGCNLLAQGAHDGLARSITPPHSRFDGDAFVAVATGEIDLADVGSYADVDTVRMLAMAAVEGAIRSV